MASPSPLLVFLSYYMTPDVCLLRKGTYEAVHQLLVVNISTVFPDTCLSPKTEILTSTRQGAFYSLMLFHAQGMLTADLLLEGIKKSVQVFRSHAYVRTSKHTHTRTHAQSFRLSDQFKQKCGPNQISVTELDLSFLITDLIQSAFKPQT